MTIPIRILLAATSFFLLPTSAPIHAQEFNAHQMTSYGLVIPTSLEGCEVRRLTYERKDAEPGKFNLYRPKAAGAAALPVVIMASATRAGSLLERAQYVDWAKALAQSGLAAVVYESRWEHNRDDLSQLITALRVNQEKWQLNGSRIGAFACSGNVFGLYDTLIAKSNDIAALALFYGAPGTIGVAPTCSTLVTSAGRDASSLNERIEQFALHAMKNGTPLEWIHYPDGHHAFDILDETPRSRQIIRQTIGFFKEELTQESIGVASPLRKALAHYDYQEWAEAVVAYRESLEANDVDEMVWLRLGRSLLELNRFEESSDALERAASLGYSPANTYYNAACMACLANDNERAIVLLQHAIDSGYNNREQMRDDQDLIALRSSKAFEDLLESMSGTR